MDQPAPTEIPPTETVTVEPTVSDTVQPTETGTVEPSETVTEEPTATPIEDQPEVVTVSVGAGPGGVSFEPSTVTINAGDTVRWVWATGGHTVTSGTNGSYDGRFCSPDNTNCVQILPAGTTYEFTFTQPGTYNYFCIPHWTMGMTGVVIVNP